MDSAALFAAVQSHALGLGVFDAVNNHPPVSPPGNQVVAAIGLNGAIRPLPGASGLAATSGLVPLLVRVYKNVQTEPQDALDPDVLTIVDLLFAAYSGDFTLGGLVRNVDLLGEFGAPMQALPGWLPYPDGGGTYRTMDVAVPLVISDIWNQAP